MTAYQNKSSQAEREQVLRNDARVRSGSTFLDHTHSEEGGRFAKPQTVIGATPTVQYPMAAPNWSVDPVGPEPSLGFSVDQHEAVGEFGEVQASIQELGDGEAVAQSSPLAAADVPSEVPASSADVLSAPQPTPNPKPTETR
jgi:hypothetical protein